MATLMSNFSKLLAWIHWTLIPSLNSLLFWFLWDDTLLVPYSSMRVPSLSYFLCHCLCFVFLTYLISALFFSLYSHKVQGYVGGCVKGHLFWRVWTSECNPCKSRGFILLTAIAGGPRIILGLMIDTCSIIGWMITATWLNLIPVYTVLIHTPVLAL